MIEKVLYLIAMIVVLGSAIVLALFYVRQTVTASIVSVLVIAAAIYLGVQRDTYLPYLGETAIPCLLLKVRTPEHANAHVTVNGLDPGTKILFWAAEPAETQKTAGLETLTNWQRAYLDFANAGVTVADEQGLATLRVRKPQPYTVPVMGRIESHVHWRTCHDGGLVGPVQTTPLTP